MISGNLVIATALAYIILLFALAYYSDLRARTGGSHLLRSPLVYTLAISVYCTSWTFYGAVGLATNNGLEFLGVYLGPTLVFVGWWFGLRKLVRIGHLQRITSVADLISSRFGKSGAIAAIVTVMAVIGTTPYIALQLKAITASLQVMMASNGVEAEITSGLDDNALALVVAAIMALFTILFGTRNVDANEQHHGVVAAIAFEAVIKLVALVAVGLFVVFGLGGGLQETFARAEDAGLAFGAQDEFGARWFTILLLSAAAIICLPRQFQITVVENANESHLKTASWAFPLYLLGMSIFTVPIAIMGKSLLPAAADPDMYVLTLPLLADQQALALFAFIGGFSSATSMIIIASIALSIMISNHIVVPLALRFSPARDDAAQKGVTQLLLASRRWSIGLILFFGFLYFWLTNGSGALAPIGLIAFTGVAQFLPAIIAALYWRDATRAGAIAGLLVGFTMWAYCLYIPSFAPTNPAIAAWVQDGLFGLTHLRPYAFLGLAGLDPLVHAVLWSLFANTITFVIVSTLSQDNHLSRLQAARFVDVFRLGSPDQSGYVRSSATLNDLFRVSRRVLGNERTKAIFDQLEAENRGHENSEPTPEFIAKLETELAGSIGAASAHVMLSQVVSGDTESIDEIIRMADETQQIHAYSQRLEQTTTELKSTADQLQLANDQLRQLDQQKDEFLSLVSHEVRTPMTAIRSFSEILRDHDDLPEPQREQFVSTIHDESLRLTGLLDQILDLSALERGEKLWTNDRLELSSVLDRAVEVCHPLAEEAKLQIEYDPPPSGIAVRAHRDRLSQVFINLISNAIKYNKNATPELSVTWKTFKNRVQIDFIDNGPGISPEQRKYVFEKFARGRPSDKPTDVGSGLGLAICREIISTFDGTLELISTRATRTIGAHFRVTLPREKV